MAAMLEPRSGPVVIGIRRRRSPHETGASGAAGTEAGGPGQASGDWVDDAGLVERSRSDPEAFGLLYDRYCDQIFRFVQRRLFDRDTAEDVTAEVFVKALKAIDTYRPQTAPFGAWLHRIAANAVIDHLRARRPTVSLDFAAEQVDRAGPVDEQAINRLEAARVWAAIEQLTDAQRAAVTLRLGHDLPIAAIAERLDRSEGAVKLLLNRGLAAVRVYLDSAAAGQETPR